MIAKFVLYATYPSMDLAILNLYVEGLGCDWLFSLKDHVLQRGVSCPGDALEVP